MSPPPADEPLLSGVVVHWGDPAPLAALAAAWPDDPRFELVVVDNGGPEGAAGAMDAGEEVRPKDGEDWAKAAGEEVRPREGGRDGEEGWAAVRWRARVVRPGVNLGFAGGANAGVAAARAPLVLLLNSDARPAPGALDALLAGFAAHPDAAGLVPRLVGPGGEPQARWQLRRLPGLRHLLLQALQWPAGPDARAEPPAGTPIEQPAAAALALRRSALDEVGGLDPRFHPAWFEDVDLAARLAAASRRLLYHPTAVFRHDLGSTVAQLGYGRFLWTYQRNLLRYLRKHHGAGAAALARLVLPGALGLRAALLPLRRPRRAASRLAALRGLAAAWLGAVSGWRLPGRWAREIDEGTGAATAAGLRGSRARGSTEPGPPSRPRRVEAGERRQAGPAFVRSAASAALGASVGPPPGEPGSTRPERVAVLVVTHDDAADLPGCLEAVAGLDHRPLEVVLVDCASVDTSVDTARSHRARLEGAGIAFRIVPLAENRGFAGGMNAALAETAADWVLTLNADARPEADYVTRLLARAAAHPDLAVGAVTGRLVRPAPAGGGRRLLDACGMRLTRTWRHLDRGSGEPDRGQYAEPARVFGATGAASLFRRAALDDVSVDGELFDSVFHTWREDAELAFRLRERGWEVLYEPAARAEHRRAVTPERRRSLPAAANLHSLKNRYLLRIYHQTPRNLLRTLVPTLTRDLAALAYVLAFERSSLAAYGWLWRHRREALARRRKIQACRTVAAGEIDRWFGIEARPLP